MIKTINIKMDKPLFKENTEQINYIYDTNTSYVVGPQLFEEGSELINFDTDIYNLLNYTDDLMRFESLNEAEYQERVNAFKVEIMDIEKFIKANDCEEITNPNFFIREGVPSPDGLLSNEIFGITQDDRSGIYAYINLNGIFMDPSCYKTWTRVDSKVKACVHGTSKFIINDKGELEENEDGESGIKFLRDNFNKIKIKSTESRKRDLKIQYLEHNFKKGRMFISKYIVIPAYYRDVNSTARHVGVGQINKLYQTLIISSKSLKETQDYGLPMTDTISARIQETLLTIYDWFCGNNSSGITEKGIGLGEKMGVIKRANLSKTSDYSSRLVLSASELKAEKIDDLMVNLDRSAVPLAAVIADFLPAMMFHMRRFFENEFVGVSEYFVMQDINKPETGRYYKLKDPMLTFSDERLKKELKRFLHGYSNRFIPIELPVEDYEKAEGKEVYMRFKGHNVKDEDAAKSLDTLVNRSLTWCDVIYMAAVESTKDKKVLICRYPIDSYYNQFPTNIVVSSTDETEPMYINSTYYPFYPKIRKEDELIDTSNRFVDTMQISNLFLHGIGGDYDGDQVTAKGSFFEETNEELERFMNSKANFVNPGCRGIRKAGNESVQAMYNLTKVLHGDETKLTNPIF